jgi:hypothetical protein
VIEGETNQVDWRAVVVADPVQETRATPRVGDKATSR